MTVVENKTATQKGMEVDMIHGFFASAPILCYL